MCRTVAALCSLLLASCAGLHVDESMRISPDDWVTFGGATDRQNKTGATVLLPLTEAWQHNANAGIAATPLVRDSVVLVCTLNGEVQAVNFLTGKRRSYSTFESSIMATPALDSSILYIPLSSNKESAIAYDMTEGRKIWTQRSLGPIEASPLVTESAVFFTTIAGMLHRLRKADGEEVWKFSPRGKDERKPIRSSPAGDGERVFFGCDDGWLYAVYAGTGELAWKFQTSRSVFASPIVSGALVLAGSLDGRLFAIDRASGMLSWEFNLGAPIYGSASSDGKTVFIGSSNGILYALELETGKQRWSFATQSALSSAALISGTTVFIGSLDRSVYALESSTGKGIWKYLATGRVRVSPVLWGNSLLVTSEDKFVTLLRSNSNLP